MFCGGPYDESVSITIDNLVLQENVSETLIIVLDSINEEVPLNSRSYKDENKIDYWIQPIALGVYKAVIEDDSLEFVINDLTYVNILCDIPDSINEWQKTRYLDRITISGKPYYCMVEHDVATCE